MPDRVSRFLASNDLTSPPSDGCEACIAGGHRKRSFAKRSTQTYSLYSYFGESLSSDLCGPFPKSLDGCQYALCIVDAYTHYAYLYFLRSKQSQEVRFAFETFLNTNRHLLPASRPVTWHTDNGGEFMSRDLDEFCSEFSVNRSFSIPYAPPQNAQAERLWGLLLRPTRIIMLYESGVSEMFWSYAMKHACELHNVLPSSLLPHAISPHECLFGSKPDVSRYRVWGCQVWYHLLDHEAAQV